MIEALSCGSVSAWPLTVTISVGIVAAVALMGWVAYLLLRYAKEGSDD